MDIRKELTKEHSKQQALRIVHYVGRNQSRLATLVKVFLEGPYRITQRASWPLTLCAETYPRLAVPHLNVLINAMQVKGAHDAVRRNVMRLLQFVPVPKRYHAKLLDVCFAFLTNRKEPVAVRVFAMSVAGNIVMQYPELKHELMSIIEDHLPYESAGYRSRGMKVLKKLNAETERQSVVRTSSAS